MALRTEELAKTFDQTLLDAESSDAAVAIICRQAREAHVASVCVLPAHVVTAGEELRRSDVKVCAVIGYPTGSAPTAAKIAEAEKALAEGAGELEFVMNTKALRRGEVGLVRDELVSFARTVRMTTANGGRGTVVLKAVIGSNLLDDKLTKLACRIVERAEMDFAQTSTGDGSAAATVQEVDLLRDALPELVGVKASGRIDTIEDVRALVNAGAGRIGSVFAIDLLTAAPLVRA
jgi:deoxyribose-phosphate aldolase